MPVLSSSVKRSAKDGFRGAEMLDQLARLRGPKAGGQRDRQPLQKMSCGGRIQQRWTKVHSERTLISRREMRVKVIRHNGFVKIVET